MIGFTSQFNLFALYLFCHDSKLLDVITPLRYKHVHGFVQIRSDRVPEELWTEVCDIVQEAVTILKKKMHKAKWLSEETLQTAEKRS